MCILFYLFLSRRERTNIYLNVYRHIILNAQCTQSQSHNKNVCITWFFITLFYFITYPISMYIKYWKGLKKIQNIKYFTSSSYFFLSVTSQVVSIQYFGCLSMYFVLRAFYYNGLSCYDYLYLLWFDEY